MYKELFPIDHLRYNLALAACSPLLAGLLASRYLSGKSRPGWSERWGHLPPEIAQQGRPVVWVHAVSAGEVAAAAPILRGLKERLPSHRLLLSVITPAGHEMALKQAGPLLDGLFYFPFDLPWVARRTVQAIRPQLFVSLESEMWPNTLHELKRAGAKTALANGRISDKNFSRSLRLGRGLYKWMAGNMDLLLMQSKQDARRITELGAVTDTKKVHTLGNSKFDQQVKRLTTTEAAQLRLALGLPETAPVLLAGSTRSAEEERVVAEAFQIMRQEMPGLCIIVAPRHLERSEETMRTLQEAGLEPVRRTSQKEKVRPAACLVLDTMGELADLYAVCDIAFIGNTFPPVVQGGGQNLLQPLAHGKPVLIGPHIATIRSETALAREAGAAFQVNSAEELAAQGLRLLKDKALRAEIEQSALALVEANRGVSERYVEALCALAAA